MIVAQLGGGNVLGEGVYIQVFVPERQVLLLPNPVVVRSRSSRLMGIAGDTRHDQMGHDQIAARMTASCLISDGEIRKSTLSTLVQKR
jgi:hypothetical protein